MEATAERAFTMAAKKSRQKRGESLLVDSEDLPVRRSPRLSSRYTPRERTFPLTASSRPSLPSYEKEQMKSRKILNESGQSVLEDEEEAELLSVSHDHTYAQKSGTNEPAHLYGLDDSDGEQMPTATEIQRRKYRVFDTERTLKTPPRPPTSQPPGLTVGRVLRWVRRAAYKLLSLVYLVPSAVLCLDVIALHQTSKRIHRRELFERAPQRTCFATLMLPVALGLLLTLLAGGVLLSTHSEPVEDLIDTIAEGEEKLAQMLNPTILSHINNYLSNFREQLVLHLESQLERLVSAREFNRWYELKNQLSDETKTRETSSGEMRAQLLEAMEERVAALSSSIAHNLSELDGHMKEAQLSSEDYRAQLSNVISSHAKATEKQQEETLESARFAWLNESLDRMKVELEKFKEKMKVELDAMLQLKDTAHTRLYEDLKPLLSTSAIMARRLEQLERTVQSHLQSNATDYTSVVAIVHEELKAMLKDGSSWLHSVLNDSIATSEYGSELGRRIAQLESTISKGALSNASETPEARVKELIREHLARYSADGIARFDFALESAGGSVLLKHCSPTFAPSQSSANLFGIPLFYFKNTPNAIIQPQVYPGECWAFEGSKGHAVIKLVTETFVNGVTLEHIPKEISLNGSRASSPKDFSVWGMHEEEHEGKLLGTFTYSLDNSPIQEFPVYNTQETYTHVKFQFLSNHGNPEYTCVYRVRVHGYLPPPK